MCKTLPPVTVLGFLGNIQRVNLLRTTPGNLILVVWGMEEPGNCTFYRSPVWETEPLPEDNNSWCLLEGYCVTVLSPFTLRATILPYESVNKAWEIEGEEWEFQSKNRTEREAYKQGMGVEKVLRKHRLLWRNPEGWLKLDCEESWVPSLLTITVKYYFGLQFPFQKCEVLHQIISTMVWTLMFPLKRIQMLTF